MDGYVDLSCGGEHTLFVDGSGGLASSGACGFSQHSDLASGPTQQAQWARPCAVRSFVAAVARQTMPPMRKAVAGYYHSLAISRTGKLFAWGCGNFGTKNDGQLGLGPSKDESLSPREVALPLESGERVVDAAAGCYHSAVLTSHHRVISFGLNNYGQLGRSGISSGPVPRSPAGSAETDTLNNYSDGVPRHVVAAHRTDVDGIGAAFYNIFQLTRDGGMLCAGSNAARQCGSAVAPHDAPSAVPELQDVVLKQATGGYCHTIALAKDGTVFTLGCGEDGQRGDGRPLETDVVPEELQEQHEDAVAEYKPCDLTTVPLAAKVSAIAAGANHSLALGLDHVTVWGWGSNEHGQLGPDVLDGTSSPQVLSLRLSPEETIVRIDAGYAHSAVLTSSGRAVLFGRGENGQLGTGTAVDETTPVTAMRPPTSPCE